MGQHRVLRDIYLERVAQDKKWGQQEHGNGYWLGILGEEFGEIAQAYIENQGRQRIREELVQLAAVAVAYIECIDRREAHDPERTLSERPGCEDVPRRTRTET